jgi:putative hydrolase of the HAD superfamily
MGGAKYFHLVAFDGDDTLWDNERLYRQAQERFDVLLASYSGSINASQRLEEMETINIHYYGYGIKSFILSMIETAVEVSSGNANGETIKQIIQIAKDMLDAEVLLMENVEETLKILSQDYDLMLITKGDQFEQESKIQRSNLNRYFRYVEIVGDKTQETYRRIFHKYQIDPSRFVMVGNSIRSDILPVVQLGGKAIYVHYQNTWAHEKVAEEERKGLEFIELDHLGQLPEYLAQWKLSRTKSRGKRESGS